MEESELQRLETVLKSNIEFVKFADTTREETADMAEWCAEKMRQLIAGIRERDQWLARFANDSEAYQDGRASMHRQLTTAVELSLTQFEEEGYDLMEVDEMCKDIRDRIKHTKP